MLPLTAVTTVINSDNYSGSSDAHPAEMMVQAFIISHLNCCKALYYGISDELFMWRLQLVQNHIADWRSLMWSHLISTLPAAQASSVAACQLQDCHVCLPVPVLSYLADKCQHFSDTHVRQTAVPSADTRMLISHVVLSVTEHLPLLHCKSGTVCHRS